MRMLCLQGQDCTCPPIVPATGVRFPSGVASHFGISVTAGWLIRVHDNRCFEYEAGMTVCTARGLPLQVVVRMVLKEERILETGPREIFFFRTMSYAS